MTFVVPCVSPWISNDKIIIVIRDSNNNHGVFWNDGIVKFLIRSVFSVKRLCENSSYDHRVVGAYSIRDAFGILRYMERFECGVSFSIFHTDARWIRSTVCRTVRPKFFIAHPFVTENIHGPFQRSTFVFVLVKRWLMVQVRSWDEFWIRVRFSLMKESNRGDGVRCAWVGMSLLEHRGKCFSKIDCAIVQNRGRHY